MAVGAGQPEGLDLTIPVEADGDVAHLAEDRHLGLAALHLGLLGDAHHQVLGLDRRVLEEIAGPVRGLEHAHPHERPRLRPLPGEHGPGRRPPTCSSSTRISSRSPRRTKGRLQADSISRIEIGSLNCPTTPSRRPQRARMYASLSSMPPLSSASMTAFTNSRQRQPTSSRALATRKSEVTSPSSPSSRSTSEATREDPTADLHAAEDLRGLLQARRVRPAGAAVALGAVASARRRGRHPAPPGPGPGRCTWSARTFPSSSIPEHVIQGTCQARSEDQRKPIRHTRRSVSVGSPIAAKGARRSSGRGARTVSASPDGKDKGQLEGVQRQTVQPEALAEEPVVLALAVVHVADEGVPDVLQVPADLVEPPAAGLRLDEGVALEGRPAARTR